MEYLEQNFNYLDQNFETQKEIMVEDLEKEERPLVDRGNTEYSDDFLE